jgi:hypothetical protein
MSGILVSYLLALKEAQESGHYYTFMVRVLEASPQESTGPSTPCWSIASHLSMIDSCMDFTSRSFVLITNHHLKYSRKFENSHRGATARLRFRHPQAVASTARRTSSLLPLALPSPSSAAPSSILRS